MGKKPLFTKAMKDEIRRYYIKTGCSYAELMRIFSIPSSATVTNILKGIFSNPQNIKQLESSMNPKKRKSTKLEHRLFKYFDEFLALYGKTDLYDTTNKMLDIFNIEQFNEFAEKKITNHEYKRIFELWMKNHNVDGEYSEIIM